MNIMTQLISAFPYLKTGKCSYGVARHPLGCREQGDCPYFGGTPFGRLNRHCSGFVLIGPNLCQHSRLEVGFYNSAAGAVVGCLRVFLM